MELPTLINTQSQPSLYVPENERSRIKAYKTYDHLQSAEHELAFNLTDKYTEDIVYLALNFPNFISKEIADMLFANPPTIEIQTGQDNEKVQEFIDDIISENNFYQMLLESAYDNSALGDNIISVRVNEDGKVELVPLDVISWTPITNRLEGQKIQGHTFYYNFIEEVEGKTKTYVWKKEYLAGQILNSAYEYIPGKPLIPVPLAVIDASLQEQETIESTDPYGNPFLLPTHIPNFRTPRDLFGVSDYRDLKDIQYEINNRASQIGNILDIHAAPDTIVPEGTLDEYGNLRKKIETKNKGMMFEVPAIGGSTDIAKKITWDGKLSDGFEEIKTLLGILASIGETDRDTLSQSEKTGANESGKALKYKLRKLIAKARRRAVIYERAIQEILAKACWLEGFKNVYQREISVSVNLDIPRDEQEGADLISTWVNNGLMSKEEAVRSRMKGKPDEQINDAISEIKKEKDQAEKDNPFLKTFVKDKDKDEE